MTKTGLLFAAMVVAAAGLFSGCAKTALDTQGFAVVESMIIEAPFPQTWQATKAVLRERDFDIYTRDKRGLFVAYSKTKRRLLVPERMQYTVTVERVSADATQVALEVVKQIYGVTLLTHYGWHDRKTTDNTEALAILSEVQALAVGEETGGA